MTAAKPPSKPKRALADWEAVERDFRAGILTYSEMALRHGVSKGRISQVAKRDGWTQDLSVKIRAKAEAKLNAATVNAELNAERSASIAETVEIGAQVIVRIKLGQRSSIQRARDLAEKLMLELETETSRKPGAPTEAGEKAPPLMPLAAKVTVLKSLTESMRTLIGLERESFGLDEIPPDSDGAPVARMSDAEMAVRLHHYLEEAKQR